MRLGLAIKGLLDTGISNEYKRTRLKVKVNDTGLVPFLETLEVLLAGLGDCFAHLSEVLGTFSELLGSGSDEFLGGDAKVLSGSEVGGFENIKREKRVDAVDHVLGGVTGSSSNSDSFSPEDLWKDFSPLGLVTFAGLHDGLANVEMLGFHDTVGSRIVPGYANVVDPITLADVVECSNVGSDPLPFRGAPESLDTVSSHLATLSNHQYSLATS